VRLSWPHPILVLTLLAGLAGWSPPGRAADAPSGPQATRGAAGRALSLDLGKSQVIRLERPARDVLVANSTIADVVLRSADLAFVIGKKVGETNVYFFDAEGRQIDAVDISVTFDSEAVAAALKNALPTEDISVSTANQAIVLSGSVVSQQEVENAQQIVRQFVSDDKAIVNLITVHDKNQVLIRVRVTEMQRNTVKELGITPAFPAPLQFNFLGFNFDFAGNPTTFGTTPYGGLSLNPGGSGLPAAIATPGLTSIPGAIAAPSISFAALLQALEQNGLVKTLAEPNLTAVSGETASFLVGGKFPLPSVVGVGASSQVVPVFYPFGVQLTFTPVVLSSGLISLRIATTVSETSTPTTISGTSVPSLTERSATTTVELPSGGGVAIAGLLQNDLSNTISGLPGVMDLPVLGALFSSKQFQHNETDLVIAVSAYLIKPVDPTAIVYPSDGFGPASDFNMYFLGRLNATYTKPTPESPRQPKGPFDFIQPKGPFGFILE
jgi:pilus assembly protein CpaC